MLLSPMSILNDGNFELCYCKGTVPLCEAFSFFSKVKGPGDYVLNPLFGIIRARNLYLVNKSLDTKTGLPTS